MIARRRFLLSISAALGAVFTPPALRAAPKKKPTESPQPTENSAQKEKRAQLRLWKATDMPQLPLSIRFQSLEKPSSAALSPFRIGTESYEFSDYIDVPSGTTTVEVSVSDKPTVTLARYLVAEGQTTLLVRFQNSMLSADWIDDTPSSMSNGAVFRIYNLLSASGELSVTVGTFLSVRLPTVRSSLRLNDIKPGVYPLTIKGTSATGEEFSENLDVDFAHSRRATLLICPDAYGRIRPRLNTI